MQTIPDFEECMLTSAFQIAPLPQVSNCQHFRYPSPLKNADMLFGWPLSESTLDTYFICIASIFVF